MSRVYNEQQYLQELEKRGRLPKGFRAGATSLAFTPGERPTQEPYKMNISCILCDQPTESFAGVFTKNAFPGAPVIIGKEKVHRNSVQGIVVNNRIANVSTATGVQDALALTRAVGETMEMDPEGIFPVSTGIIGWKLPIPEMLGALGSLKSSLQNQQVLPVAQAIMTTDSFPKVRSVPLGEGTLVGIAKGAGMIEPNMATMLVFLLTDVGFHRNQGQESLQRVVDRTFNAISVDGDQSTSDMCLLLGSQHLPQVSQQELETALSQVCQELAEDIVRNGEGTSHVIAVRVRGRATNEEARSLGKAVINSPLVKTAIYGNDPNVGRILSSLGDYLGNNGLASDLGLLDITIGEHQVLSKGVFTLSKEKELALSEYFSDSSMNPRIKGYPQHQKSVEILVDFHQGPGEARVLGSDLTHEYVHENADYRS